MATTSYDVRRVALVVAAGLLVSGCSLGRANPLAERCPRRARAACPRPSPRAPSRRRPPPRPRSRPEPAAEAVPGLHAGLLPAPARRWRPPSRRGPRAHGRLHVVRRVVPERTPPGDRSAQRPHRARAVPRGGAGPWLHRPCHLRLGAGHDPRARATWRAQGFVAFHVDYRNHAGSDDDPPAARRLRIGYALDVINAVQALRRSPRVPVDDERVALFGRSMGGGVVYKALEIAPGFVQAASAWASVSSLEDENFDHFIRDDGDRDPLVQFVEREYGLPGQPAFGKVLAGDQRAPVLRPDHRAAAARPRQVRLDLPARLGPRVVPGPPRGRCRRADGVVPRRARVRSVVLRGDGAHDPVLPRPAGLKPGGWRVPLGLVSLQRRRTDGIPGRPGIPSKASDGAMSRGPRASAGGVGGRRRCRRRPGPGAGWS